jgi:hypothetical protein
MTPMANIRRLHSLVEDGLGCFTKFQGLRMVSRPRAVVCTGGPNQGQPIGDGAMLDDRWAFEGS